MASACSPPPPTLPHTHTPTLTQTHAHTHALPKQAGVEDASVASLFWTICWLRALPIHTHIHTTQIPTLSPHLAQIRRQALWSIASLALHSYSRPILVQLGAVGVAIRCIDEHNDKESLEQATFENACFLATRPPAFSRGGGSK